MILTLLALATSMFWFPAPEHSDPMTLEFLAVEREYLTGDWTMAKVLMASLVPISLRLWASSSGSALLSMGWCCSMR